MGWATFTGTTGGEMTKNKHEEREKKRGEQQSETPTKTSRQEDFRVKVLINHIQFSLRTS